MVVCNGRQGTAALLATDFGIVGYTGHIPGLRDMIGKSHGYTVARLLIPGSHDGITKYAALRGRFSCGSKLPHYKTPTRVFDMPFASFYTGPDYGMHHEAKPHTSGHDHHVADHCIVSLCSTKGIIHPGDHHPEGHHNEYHLPGGHHSEAHHQEGHHPGVHHQEGCHPGGHHPGVHHQEGHHPGAHHSGGHHNEDHHPGVHHTEDHHHPGGHHIDHPEDRHKEDLGILCSGDSRTEDLHLEDCHTGQLIPEDTPKIKGLRGHDSLHKHINRQFILSPSLTESQRPRHGMCSIQTCQSSSNDISKVDPTNLPSQRSTCSNEPANKSYVSLFDIPCDDPSKYLPTGYTGFVPLMRDLYGISYPEASRRAMHRLGVRFSAQRLKRKCAAESSSSGVTKTGIAKCPWLPIGDKPPEIYQSDRGLLPHYTGHLPGYRWRYGATFGLSTRDLKKELDHP